MQQSVNPMEAELKERLRFEELLSNISSRFVNIPPERVDAEINHALKEVIEFFQVDRCSLIQITPERDAWQTTHLAVVESLPSFPLGVELSLSMLPWACEKLILKHEIISFSRLDELPPEANVDKQTWTEGGVRSNLNIPILIGESVNRVICLNSVNSERVWPEEYIPRLRLLGEILVNAVELRQARLEVEQHLRFERLISDLSARFINLAPDKISDEIEGGQRQICELLGLDRSALFQLPEGEPRVMALTSLHQSKGSPPVPERVNGMDFFPWTVQKILSGETVTIGKMSDFPSEAARDREKLRRFGTKSTVVVPLSIGGGPVFGGLTFAAIREETDWPETVVKGFQLIAQVFANALARKRADEQLKKHVGEIENLKQRLEKENIYLQEEVRLLTEHTEIVGQSPAIKKVLGQVEQVARTESTVLIQGETGTGKELFARAIHSLSSRKDRPLIAVNCASLPPTLIESELFGRERGAYTGALTKMVGRFEIADGSTLFLDEIGELPLDVQSKLLKVLDDGSFERLGSTKTLHVNVRIIAATNRDLGKEVKAGRFRKDLYYRLNVFPITIPPLRERPEDIPPMVAAFVTKLQKRMGKEIETISKKSIEALKSYSWPGNVRELKNVIKHAMILSKDNTLVIRLPKSGLPETD
ncbi:MAG: sigma 54-interacting transcriptional regulator, partial [Deltaproteobacteria bacterium]